MRCPKERDVFGRVKRVTAENFWRRLIKQPGDGCWLWGSPARVSRFYGAVSFEGKKDYAHRVAWRFANGPIPNGVCVLHRCDNPLCCRPDHLFLGSQADNMRDMATKRRSCLGERNRAAKLSEPAVKEIRRLRGISKTFRQIADSYGVSASVIFRIIKGDIWRSA